jgi:hypothetical protein
MSPDINMLDSKRSRMKPREDGKIVFCKQCRFSKGMTFFSDCSESCEHPNNIYYENSYDEPDRKHREHPSHINKYNNCVWYKPRRNLFQTILSIFKGE